MNIISAINTKGAKKITRTRLNSTDTVKVYEALKDLLSTANNGHVTYKGNYTDAKVAKSLGVTERNVYSVRMKLFGKLKNDAKPISYPKLLQKYAELHARVEHLEQQLGIK